MSESLGRILLKGDRILVPFENIAGRRQVSSFIIVSEGQQKVFSLVGSNEDVGPVDLTHTEVTADNLNAWLSSYKDNYEDIYPTDVHVTQWSFLYNGIVETVVYSIDITGKDGCTLRMSRDGAAYPYTLALADKS